MNPTLIGIIGIVIMLAIFMTRMPVAYVMALVGFVGFSLMISPKGGLNLLSRNIYEVFSSYGLTTIPLFILMGQIAFNAGISRKLYDTAYKFLGNIRGGLAMATVSACTAFGAVCGSSPATAATMATVGLPEMRRYNYNVHRCCGIGRGFGHDHASQCCINRLWRINGAVHRCTVRFRGLACDSYNHLVYNLHIY